MALARRADTGKTTRPDTADAEVGNQLDETEVLATLETEIFGDDQDRTVIGIRNGLMIGATTWVVAALVGIALLA